MSQNQLKYLPSTTDWHYDAVASLLNALIIQLEIELNKEVGAIFMLGTDWQLSEGARNLNILLKFLEEEKGYTPPFVVASGVDWLLARIPELLEDIGKNLAPSGSE